MFFLSQMNLRTIIKSKRYNLTIRIIRERRGFAFVLKFVRARKDSYISSIRRVFPELQENILVFAFPHGEDQRTEKVEEEVAAHKYLSFDRAHSLRCLHSSGNIQLRQRERLSTRNVRFCRETWICKCSIAWERGEAFWQGLPFNLAAPSTRISDTHFSFLPSFAL